MGTTDSDDRDECPGGMDKIETQGDLEGQGGAGGSTDQGNTGGKEESDGARGMEGRGAARAVEDRGVVGSTPDQGGAGGTREPCGVRGLMNLGGAEGAWSQGEAERSDGQGGFEDSEDCHGARGSSCQTEAGDWKLVTGKIADSGEQELVETRGSGKHSTSSCTGTDHVNGKHTPGQMFWEALALACHSLQAWAFRLWWVHASSLYNSWLVAG